MAVSRGIERAVVVTGLRGSGTFQREEVRGGRGATRAESGVTSVANGTGSCGSGPFREDDGEGGRGATRAADENASYFRVCRR